MSVLDGATVLITGGTGTFGQALLHHTLENFTPRKVIVFSRDEMKQWEMARRYVDDSRVKFVLGDVRDQAALSRAMVGVSHVLHAAAVKIVPTGESNPFETVKTNVIGAMNIKEAALDRGVEKVLAISTDKATSPKSLYGATKLVAEKIFILGNSEEEPRGTICGVVRLGNLLGSRGSVIPHFLSLKAAGRPLHITDERMTRFMMTVEQGVDLAITALGNMSGGEVFVGKVPSMNIMDIAEAIDPGGHRLFVGQRAGEQLHEQLIGPDNFPHTMDYGDHYRIPSAQEPVGIVDKSPVSGVAVDANFAYRSDTNDQWLSPEELRAWIENRYKLG
jgi:UDP-N-acetylglucosamine 4,6-dehydratase/5-epimerase